MPRFDVKMERVRTCDGRVAGKRSGTVILSVADVDTAINKALEYAGDAQAGVFGDTGMDDGTYEVTVVSVNGEPVEKKTTGWAMVECKKE